MVFNEAISNSTPSPKIASSCKDTGTHSIFQPEAFSLTFIFGCWCMAPNTGPGSRLERHQRRSSSAESTTVAPAGTRVVIAPLPWTWADIRFESSKRTNAAGSLSTQCATFGEVGSMGVANLQNLNQGISKGTVSSTENDS